MWICGCEHVCVVEGMWACGCAYQLSPSSVTVPGGQNLHSRHWCKNRT